jgi:hypothetical protein
MSELTLGPVLAGGLGTIGFALLGGTSAAVGAVLVVLLLAGIAPALTD